MPTELNRSFLAVYLEWKEKNPSRLQKAVLRSLDHAFHFFKEIDQFPYEEISDDMITFIIEKYASVTTRKNMRFLIDSIDRYLRNTESPEFRHGPFTDHQAVWLVIHHRNIVSLPQLRERISSINGAQLSFETLAAKHLINQYDRQTEGSLNILRMGILRFEAFFGKSLSSCDNEKLEETVRNAPEWVRSSVRCALAGIRQLDKEYSATPVTQGEQSLQPVVPPDHDPSNDAMECSLWDSTLDDVHRMWLESYAGALSESSLIHLNTGWNVLKPLWKKMMREITVSELQFLINQVSPGTQELTYELYKKLEDVAYSLDLIHRRRSNLLRTDEIILRDRIPLTDDDIESLKQHQGEWYVDITLFLYYTGFRAGEFAALKKQNINLPLLEIVGGSKTQYGVNRVIPIHPNIESIIRTWIENEPGEMLIAHEDGSPFSNRDVEHAVKMATAAYCSQSHIPHECRHTFYTNLQRNGENSAACVARLAGHNPYPLPVDVRVYAHPTPDQLRVAINSLK